MKLVLAEKPSVAQSIAKVIGATTRFDGYLEGNGYIVSWCVGHLVELSEPEGYEEKYSKWRYDDLPIIPDEWKYQVSAKTKKQFGIIKQLMCREDVESLVCATDAGREGELIFRLVYQQCGCKKPFERLWISSMEDSAIKEGFANLRPSTEYDALYEAALSRERADWIVGINATRLFSVLYGQTLNVGRVMTPTLGMVVMREAAISAFKSEPFYTIQLCFTEFAAVSEKIKDCALTETLEKKCRDNGSAVVTKIEKKEKQENAPALYDLTSLQRDANRILGFTAQQTLDYAQSLYEKKMITYPRTDSRYLTEDMADSVSELISQIAVVFEVPQISSINVSQVINRKKVTDHHAIIPTKSVSDTDLRGLPAGELAILRLISNRLLLAVGRPYSYSETIMELDCGGVIFTAKGKSIIDDGWKQMEREFWLDDKQKKENIDLPNVVVGEKLNIAHVEIKEGKTTAPKHFTEDTLLQAMENAGEKDMQEGTDYRGIGTPATRAGIIEKLIQKGFIERIGDKKIKHLMPTSKGIALITVIPEIIQSPAMTADWEEKLARIERKDYEAEDFMREIEELVSSLIKTYEAVKGAEFLLPKNAAIGSCPHCGNEVVERSKGWFCTKRECRFALWKEGGYFQRIGKQLTGRIVEKLIKERNVKLKDCQSTKTGKKYNATVFLETEADGSAKFRMEFGNGGR